VGLKTRTTKSDPPATRTHTPGFSAIQIREQLKRILASSDFANSERMCRFLKLAVEYAIDNRAGELKEYCVFCWPFPQSAPLGTAQAFPAHAGAFLGTHPVESTQHQDRP
jgi:hypothetical protein